MFLKRLSLQNFRSYSQTQFDFHKGTTLIIGPNTAGKTNLIESIFFLSTGKSFRADKDIEVIGFEKEIARITGLIERNADETKLEIVLPRNAFKRYLVNGIARRRVDFAGNLASVLFSPQSVDLIIGSPSVRRTFLDTILEQINRDYRIALTNYTKALRQRNALLERAQEEGKRDEEDFIYWDNLLIENGQFITAKRDELIGFFNEEKKDIFQCTLIYDKSTISKERLLQYKDAELGSGVTLVGPHRDDLAIYMQDREKQVRDVKLFGSRGQQRLVVLQLKLLELTRIEQQFQEPPILLLDDVFSELDEGHIQHTLNLIGRQQTILTTTHKEFVAKDMLKDMTVIELT